jgi:hypothetical protein
MPLSSRHLQAAPSTLVTQLHVAFSAHSLSHEQAAPPGALSSQYQPTGQMPEPHTLHVPSSQLGPRDDSTAAVASSSG